jgi:hypothetical protein
VEKVGIEGPEWAMSRSLEINMRSSEDGVKSRRADQDQETAER